MEQGYLYIDTNIFPTLLAISQQEQELGLMHEPWPPPNMTFIYTRAMVNKFWMHQTPSPLDIIFCHNGIVNQICKGEPFSTSIIGGDIPSDMIVELPLGTVDNSNIKLGHKVGLVKPTRDELMRIVAEKYVGIVKY
jgi:uncharacterized protein